jgi:uncharacterized protein YifN (PemK superfamily)
MKINYKHFEDTLTFARISEIKIDTDFSKEMIDNQENKTAINGRILLTVKLYTNEDGHKIYNHHKHIIEDMPIEGVNFYFCKNEIAQLENVLNAIISERLNKAK